MLNILITGANGQLGNEMRRLGSVSPHNYIYTDVAELNITDAASVMQSVNQNKIDVIVNCAAYTNVERAEEDEATADLLNHKAAKNLADAAKAAGATLIHVSTDYVFDGMGLFLIRKICRPHLSAPMAARNWQANRAYRNRAANILFFVQHGSIRNTGTTS